MSGAATKATTNRDLPRVPERLNGVLDARPKPALPPARCRSVWLR